MTILFCAMDSWIDEIRNSEVLLIFDDSDDFYIKKWIIPELEAKNLKFVLPEIHIPPGRPKLSLMPEAIENSKKVLIILSEHTKKRFKCTFEIFLALEKSLSTNKMCVTIALLGSLDRRDVPKIPMLEHSMIAKVTENDQPYTIEKVIENIKDDSVTLSEKMPAGNLATGLAWSHFLGYLSIILPELATNIIECEWFQRFQGKMSTRFFMLLPKSGTCRPLQDQDSRITHVGNLKIEVHIAGTKRVYTPNVYCIQDEEKQEHYYCCAEIPNAFGCIGKIFHEKLGMLNSQQRNLEVERFYHVLDQILSHENNKRCHMLYEVITYNDEDKTEDGLPSTHILRHFHKEHTEDRDEETKSHKKYKYDVCLLYGKDDENKAHFIRQTLMAKPDKPRIAEACPDQVSIAEVTEQVKDSKWVVLLLSKNQKWFEFWIVELLCSGVETGEFESQDICVLPLLYNVDPESIPSFIRWLTYIEAKEGEDFVERIYEIIKGQRVALRTQSPVGNVHEGLVWGFVVNYLRHVLPDITERIKQKLHQLGVDTSDRRNHYHTGLLELVPQNCEVPARMDIISDQFKIENMGRIEATKKQQQQKVVRVFACNFYKLTKKDGDSYYFAGEFATPIRTLHGMGASVICGLTADKMKKEVKMFTDKLERIMKKENDGQNCAILRVNGENQNLVDEVIKEIRENEIWQKSQQ
ncbi:uncharacterized protein LOC127737431 isoform X2 [Mytilus californianus]|uniref:uncharacterized protein LOC127737431 isoform X2 n=1 Tax=Mytilus californianus TaxID=6549 RepID=UPI0022482506|nr:uncharacterized protein LOC127737431 isoform X2 [Mytilus californianus]